MKFRTSVIQTRVASPLGDIDLAASDLGLVGLWFVDQRHRPAQLNGLKAWPSHDGHPVLQTASVQLKEYFAGKRKRFDVPLDINGGTIFQQSVWRALLKIPLGQTTSYGDISKQIGKPTAMRAVGSAVGRNPVSLIIPCHRVLGRTGTLTGYAGGLERKTALLTLEGAKFQAM